MALELILKQCCLPENNRILPLIPCLTIAHLADVGPEGIRQWDDADNIKILIQGVADEWERRMRCSDPGNAGVEKHGVLEQESTDRERENEPPTPGGEDEENKSEHNSLSFVNRKSRKMEDWGALFENAVREIFAHARDEGCLRVEWICVRHVLSVSLILRLTERFIKYLREVYVFQSEESDEAQFSSSDFDFSPPAESDASQESSNASPPVIASSAPNPLPFTGSPPLSAFEDVFPEHTHNNSAEVAAALWNDLMSMHDQFGETASASSRGEHTTYTRSVRKKQHPAFEQLVVCEQVPVDPWDVTGLYNHDILRFFRYRRGLVRALRARSHPPFTLLRLCELLTPANQSWRTNFWKWCLALKKCILDVSSSFPGDTLSPEQQDINLFSTLRASHEADTPQKLRDYRFIHPA